MEFSQSIDTVCDSKGREHAENKLVNYLVSSMVSIKTIMLALSTRNGRTEGYVCLLLLICLKKKMLLLAKRRQEKTENVQF